MEKQYRLAMLAEWGCANATSVAYQNRIEGVQGCRALVIRRFPLRFSYSRFPVVASSN